MDDGGPSETKAKAALPKIEPLRAQEPMLWPISGREQMKRDKRLYQSVADRLVALMESGAYPPGSRLPCERELAEMFDVSRVTVREAGIALQALGRIKIRTGSGAYVLDATKQAGNGLPNVSAFEVTEARLLFESEAAALAAPDIGNETLARLEGLVENMTHSTSDAEAETADRDFHLTIAAASGNAVVHHIVETLWKMRTDLEQVREVYESVCSEDASERGAEHSEIFQALRRRDPAAARIAMRKHFRRLMESMLDVTEEQAVEEIRKKASESRRRFLKSARI